MTKELYNEAYYRHSKKFQIRRSRHELLIKELLKCCPKTILDVGCGWGVFVEMCREKGLEACGIDFAPILKEKFWDNKPYLLEADAKSIPFPDKFFDVVVSSDFFEHLPESEISIVLKEMERVGRKVIARIPPLALLTEAQAKYHITNKSKKWWRNKLKNVTILEYD